MAERHSSLAKREIFVAGPAFSGGPEFRHSLNDFLTRVGSESAFDFADVWCQAGQQAQIPTWTQLKLFRHPALLANTYLLERPEGDDRYFVRFIGAGAVERSGIDPTGLSLDQIDQGKMYERWISANDYCLSTDGVCIVDFDLRFVDKAFKKLSALIFPLASPNRSRFTCGFYIWSD